MKKDNLKFTQEEIKELTDSYKKKNFAEFNKKFEEMTSLIETSRLVDKFHELSASFGHYREVIDAGLENLIRKVDTDPTNIALDPDTNKKNLKYFSQFKHCGPPDFVRVSQRISKDFALLGKMSLMLDRGYRRHVKRCKLFSSSDDGIDFFKTDEEVSNYILSIYNLSVNLKSKDSEIEK